MKTLLRHLSITILFFCFSTTLFSAPVDRETAKTVGLCFASSVVNIAERSSLCEWSYTHTWQEDRATATEVFHIFNIGENGFVIVSADDRAVPILGYSRESRFDPDNIPPNMLFMMNEYAREMEVLIKENIPADERVIREWTVLKSDHIDRSFFIQDSKAVPQLLTTTWNQGNHYNKFCPEAANGPGGHVYAGCVATAMAQIIRYWEYPLSGTGNYRFTHSTYGESNIDYAEQTYNYNLMPAFIETVWSQAHNDYIPVNQTEADEIAKLTYHCGISVGMNWGSNVSGAYDISARAALINHFRYNPYTEYLNRTDHPATWEDKLKNEIDNGRPVYYSGAGSSGGHAFVCDGYDQSGYFHFNWGWSGSYNGYFLCDNLNPGSYVFDSQQTVLIKIMPRTFGEAAIPAAPADFIVTPGANNQLSATLSWNNPTTTRSGDPLTSLTSIVIQKEGTVIHTITDNLVPGAALSWTDHTISNAGYAAYEIYATNEAGEGIHTMAKTFVGVGCPVTIIMNDSYGDGWNGAYIDFQNEEGVSLGTTTIQTGSTHTEFLLLPEIDIFCVWVSGGWDSECSFSIQTMEGELLYSNSEAPEQGLFFTFSHSCPQGSSSNSGYTNPLTETEIPLNSLLSEDGGSENIDDPTACIIPRIGTAEFAVSECVVGPTTLLNPAINTFWGLLHEAILTLYPENPSSILYVSSGNLYMHNYSNQAMVLTIYDGVGTSGEMLAQYNRVSSGTIPMLLSSSGPLTFQYISSTYGSSSYSTYGNNYGFDLEVKSVDCLPSIGNLKAIQITDESAVISWNALPVISTDEEWEIEYDVAGFEQGTGNMLSTDSCSAQITGLIPETQYEVYLHYRCREGGEEKITVPISFTTLPAYNCGGVIAGTYSYTDSHYPFYSSSDYSSYSQQIFTADELMDAGLISGDIIQTITIQFENLIANAADSVRIFIANTDISSFPNGSSWISASEMKEVYSGYLRYNEYTVDKEMLIYFDSSFVWTGSNIVIAFLKKKNSLNYQSANSYRTSYTNSSNDLNLHSYNDDIEIDPYSSNLIGSRTYKRNNISFCSSGKCQKPEIFMITDHGEGELLLDWQPVGEEEAWTIEYGYSGFLGGNGIVIYTESHPVTIENLPAGVYDFYLQADCGEEGISSCLVENAVPVGVDCEKRIGNEMISISYPLWSNKPYAYSQQIYLKEELYEQGFSMGERIYAISFQYAGNNQTTRDIVIYLGNTTAEVFNSSISSFIPYQNLQEVFSGDFTFHGRLSDGWITINLTEPFVWTGENLVIALLDNSGYTSTAQFYGSNTPDNKYRAKYINNNFYPIDISSLSGSGSYHDYRNNLRFCTTPPECATPTQIEIINEEEGLILTWEATDNQENWIIEYGHAGFEQGSGIYLYPTLPQCTLPITDNGFYDIYIRSSCGEDNFSLWFPILNYEKREVCIKQIGSGTIQNQYLPFNTYQNYSYSQQIYKTEEIIALGLQKDEMINKIYFQFKGNEVTRNITIYLANTSQSLFESSEDWVPFNDLQQVYSGDVTFISGSEEGSWVEILLDDSFYWDGESNIAVTVWDQTGYWDFQRYFLVEEREEMVSKYYSYYSGNTFSPLNNLYGTRLSLRNNILFCTTAPTCLSVSDLNIQESEEDILLTWNSEEDISEWRVEYGTMGFTPGTGTTVTVTQPQCRLIIPPGFYDFHVQSVCEEDILSIPKSILGVSRSVNCEPTITSGMNTTTDLPCTRAYGHSFTQQIFTSEELTALGLTPYDIIHSLGFQYVVSSGTYERDITIYLSNTTQSSFSSGTNWVPFDDSQIVFSGKKSFGNEEFTMITFSSPFYWSGDNIVISVWDKTSESINASFYSGTLSTYLSNYYSSSSSVTQSSIMSSSGNNSKIRNNIRFCISSVNCPVISDLVAIPNENGSAFVSWTPGGDETTWIIEYGIKSFVRGSGITVTVTEPHYTIENLLAGWHYDVYVQSYCGAGEALGVPVKTIFRISPQTATLPYFNNFEDENENAQWSFPETEYPSIWHIGEATQYEGSKSLYVTNDGGLNNAYTATTSTYIYAIRQVEIDGSGRYEVSYDWKSMGRLNRGFTRAFLVPEDIVFETNISNGVLPTGAPEGWIAIDGGNALYDFNTWQSHTQIIQIPQPGKYQLLFYWNNFAASANYNPPGAIDDVSIREYCAVPEELSTNANGNSINLSWEPVIDVTGYNLYRDGLLIAENIEETTYTDAGLFYETDYCYAITSIRTSCESELSAPVCTTTGDAPCPTPTNLTATVNENSISLQWNMVNDATEYIIYRDEVVISSSETTAFTDQNLEYGTEYCYFVMANCPEGGSLRSNRVCKSTLPCNSVQNLQVEVDNILVSLTWDEPEGVYEWSAINNPSLSYYSIYRDDELLSTTTERAFSELLPYSDVYQYCVIHSKGGCVAEEQCVTASLHNLSCGVPDFTLMDASDENGYIIQLIISPLIEAAYYKGYLNGELIGQTNPGEFSMTVNNLIPGNEYCFTMTSVCILDDMEVESSPSNTNCFTVDCFVPPTLSGSSTGKIITLSWQNEAAHYDLYRNDILIAENISTTNYADFGTHLEEGMQYCYQVKPYCTHQENIWSNSWCVTIETCAEEILYTEAICQGEIYNENGFSESVTGIYYQNLLSSTYCDSTVILDLTVHILDTTRLNIPICEGEHYSENGFDESVAGTYYQYLENSHHCDSVVILTLTINPVNETSLTDTICEGESYSFFGDELTTAGEYTRTLQNTFGCDSIIHLTLIVNPIHETSIADTICQGDIYNFFGDELTTAGNYTHTLQNTFGCDSIIHLTLIVNPIHETSIDDTICEGESYSFFGDELTTAGNYTHTLQNIFGCDSIINLSLIVNSVYDIQILHTACDSCTWNGMTFTTSGIYPYSTTSSHGCDSTVTLILTINESNSSSFEITTEDAYTWNGTTYSQSGVYVQTFTNASGCDSVVTLNLTIIHVCHTPANLSGSADGNEIILTWDNVSSANSYNVFRDGSQVAGGVTIPTYSDSELQYETQYTYRVSSVCDHGESELSNQVIVTTGVSGIDDNKNCYKIYPNPASHAVTVEGDNIKTIEIYSIIGQHLKTESGGDSKWIINTEAYSSGVYIFRIITKDGNEFSEQVVVAN